MEREHEKSKQSYQDSLLGVMTQLVNDNAAKNEALIVTSAAIQHLTGVLSQRYDSAQGEVDFPED